MRYRKSLLCLKLSNSGNVLKYLVLSDNRKIVCGWTNISCIVIIQVIIFEETYQPILSMNPYVKLGIGWMDGIRTKLINMVSNHLLFRVIHYKKETSISYRGSKSITTLQNFTTKNVIVKEQRVYGSWLGVNPRLKMYSNGQRKLLSNFILF